MSRTNHSAGSGFLDALGLIMLALIVAASATTPTHAADRPMPHPAFNADRRGEWRHRRAIKPINMEAFERRWDRIPVDPAHEKSN